ncbi:MAG: YeiH family protein [bacterium]|nr:YeiH family protein [bacterium]
MKFLKNKGRGLLLCLCIATPSWVLGQQYPVIGGPVFAILMGMVIGFCYGTKESLTAGITFASKKVLQYAVILLGFGLNLSSILKTGATSLPIIVCTISTSLIISYVLCKVMHIPGKIATLVGVGSSICGGSAIAATAPVIDADDAEIAQSISIIFLFNIIAALIFPTLGEVLGFSNQGFGIFAGTAINDTSSVTAAASAWDSMHNTGTQVLDTATIVKLTRTLAIIPITLVLALHRAKHEKVEGNKVSIKKVFPMFILYFVLASVITTVFQYMIDQSVITGAAATTIVELFAFLKKVSKFFIVVAMAAIGLNTDLIKLVKTGGKPILMGFACWVGIAVVSFSLQQMLGIH